MRLCYTGSAWYVENSLRILCVPFSALFAILYENSIAKDTEYAQRIRKE
jgi:hypothetical protein